MDHSRDRDRDRDRRENDPERARSSREERPQPLDDVRNRDESETSDLGRAQAEGNLGNERTRGRGSDVDRLPDE